MIWVSAEMHNIKGMLEFQRARDQLVWLFYLMVGIHNPITFYFGSNTILEDKNILIGRLDVWK